MKKLLTSQVTCFAFLQNALSFLDFSNYVFIFDTDETDEEDENKEYVEETNRDVAAIAACKLLISDVVPKVLSSRALSLLL